MSGFILARKQHAFFRESDNHMELANNNNSETTQKFLSYYVQNQKRIHGYILSVTSNWSDAEDILQDVTALMWQKFDQFEEGTSFASWGIQVAKYKILEHRRKSKKQIDLSEDVFEQLLEYAEKRQSKYSTTQNALERCLKKLSVNDYKLVQMRYMQNNSIKDMAMKLERPIHGLYKVMARIHSSLLLCVRGQLKAEEKL